MELRTAELALLYEAAVGSVKLVGGYPIRISSSILIDQAVGHRRVAEGLSRIPELIELHTVTGDADMMATIVARSTEDLQRVIDLVATTEGISRAWSRLVLETHLGDRTLPLVRSTAAAES